MSRRQKYSGRLVIRNWKADETAGGGGDGSERKFSEVGEGRRWRRKQMSAIKGMGVTGRSSSPG